MKHHHYFISYAFSDGKGYGNGHCDMITRLEYSNHNKIIEAEKIINENNFKDKPDVKVCIINFILLKKKCKCGGLIE